MKLPIRLLTLAILALLVSCISSCQIYDTVARTVGLPESTKPSAMREGALGAPVSDSNIYDVEINDATIRYLERRRAAQ